MSANGGAARGGTDLDEVSRNPMIAESTWHHGVSQYPGMKANGARRLKELEGEDAGLKKLLVDAELHKDMLPGDRVGKLLTPNRKRAAVTMLLDRFGVSQRRA